MNDSKNLSICFFVISSVFLAIGAGAFCITKLKVLRNFLPGGNAYVHMRLCMRSKKKLLLSPERVPSLTLEIVAAPQKILLCSYL